MKTPLKPDALCDRGDVAVETETRTVTDAEFETARDLESHVTVGIETDAGELLFVAAGARGWTLPAAPVGHDEEWAATGRRVCESLTGVAAEIDEPVRVRRVDFESETDSGRRHTTYDVLVRTESVPGRPVAEEPTVAGDAVTDVVWLKETPADGSSGLEADVRALLD